MANAEVPHVPVFIDDENVEKGSRDVIKQIRPHWDFEDTKFKLFTDGITNKLIGWFSGDDGILVRIYGKNTDRHIDREAELRNFKILYYAGHAPDLYATFENGIIYKFIEGETLDTVTVREPSIYRMVAKEMAKFHKLDIGDPWTTKPQIWNKIDLYLKLIPDTLSSTTKDARFKKAFPYGVQGLRSEIEAVKLVVEKIKSPTVFSHNDLLLSNIIVQRNSSGRPIKISFIDYEYSMPNCQAFDIANHFIEFAGVQDPDFSLYPGEKMQLDWLRNYLEEYLEKPLMLNDPEIKILKHHVDIFVNVSHLLWIPWSIVQAEYSKIDFDYIGYAESRYNEFKISKRKIKENTN
ncbi:ethanolamine kinase 1 [Daktulosphaira vitifoliae]|uniref:ethanolamine kinase 1 n=1 Tax=Daktulosphaira vitifoliae TaxID=58002 RepID=UPI0021A9A6FD|nr:ethanolamine kinase 1 [Daktulosphaira vitifoliae]XP_050545829.1 ethanolamine kinase 1 [Daktulosphaira vitifoliae]XP_050545830.1 ethanolamine kinase 1 [Daktulosphaira vitifoliae]